MDELNKLYEYLLADNIISFENDIFEIIPELMAEKDFEQKSEWHNLDVWHHTLATINACDNNAEDRLILLLHDIGKPYSYQDDGNVRHFKNHANKSAEMATDILKRLNVPAEDALLMIKLIQMHSTKIDVNDINLDNITFYKRLLKIQYCDAHGYEKEHYKIIVNNLDNTKKLIKQIK